MSLWAMTMSRKVMALSVHAVAEVGVADGNRKEQHDR